MNIIYHIAVGAASSHLVVGEIKPQVVIASMLPDIFGLTYHYSKKLINSVKDTKGLNPVRIYRHFEKYPGFVNKADGVLYRSTHSLLGFAFFSICLIFLGVEPLWLVLLNYILHVFVDIPSHEGVWSTRLFYPLSDFHFEGSNWWESPKRSLTVWVLSFLVYLFGLLLLS